MWFSIRSFQLQCATRSADATSGSSPGWWLPMCFGQRVERVVERRGRVGVREHHPFPHADRRRQQAPVLQLEIGELVLALRDDAQRAIKRVPPVVVEAADPVGGVTAPVDHHHPAVPAQVLERAELSVLAPHDDDRHAADRARDVVADLGERVGRADQRPRPREQAALLPLVPTRVVVRESGQQEPALVDRRHHEVKNTPGRFQRRAPTVAAGSFL